MGKKIRRVKLKVVELYEEQIVKLDNWAPYGKQSDYIRRAIDAYEGK